MSEAFKLKNTVISDVQSCLISSQKELTVRQLSCDYRKLLGEHIPYRSLGYSTLEEFLKDIPNIRIRYVCNDMMLSGISTKETDHIRKLIENQRASQRGPPRFRKPNQNNYRPNYSIPRPRIQIVPNYLQTKISEFLETFPDAGLPLESFQMAYAKHHGTELNFHQCGFESVEKLLEEIPNIVTLSNSTLNSEIRVTKTVDHAETETTTFNEEPLLNENIRKCILKVLNKFPEGIWMVDFEEQYEKINSKRLDMSGHANIMDFVEVYPGIFAVKKASYEHGNMNFMLFNAETYVEAPEPPISPKLSDETMTNILTILNIAPGGMTDRDLDQTYSINFKKEIPWKASGFHSLRELLFEVQRMGRVVLSSAENGNVLVNLVSEPGSNISGSIFVSEGDSSSSPEPTENPLDISADATRLHSRQEVDMPSDIVLPGVVYQKQWFPDDFDLSDYFKVYVSQVDSPSCLYIQLIGNEYCLALEKMMKKLNLYYYGSNERKYIMPDSYVMKSMICAAIYPEDDRWHRALIISLPSLDTATVRFVDYGTELTVSRKNIRFLKKTFLTLPTQAIEARLAGIKPAEYHWCRESQRLVLRYCDQPVFVQVLNLNYKGRVSVDLCYMSNDEEIHICDLLFDCGFAKQSRDRESDDEDFDMHEAGPSSEGFEPTITRDSSTVPSHDAEHHFAQNPLSAENLDSITPPRQAEPVKVFHSPYESSRQKCLKKSTDVVLGVSTTQQFSSDENLENQNSSAGDASENTEGSVKASRNSSPDIYQSDEDGMNDRMIKSPELPQTKFCKTVQFTPDYKGHIIKYQRRPHLSGPNLSSFIFGLDVIEQMFQCKLIVVSKTTVQREECPRLFEELEKLQAAGFTRTDSKKSELVLYPLESCLEALAKMKHMSTSLKNSILSHLHAFNPDESYWTDVDEEEIKSLFASAVPEMKQKLSGLQERRKMLLLQMARHDDFDKDTANAEYRALGNIQMEMLILQENIIEAKEEGQSHFTSNPNPQQPNNAIPTSTTSTTNARNLNHPNSNNVFYPRYTLTPNGHFHTHTPNNPFSTHTQRPNGPFINPMPFVAQMYNQSQVPLAFPLSRVVYPVNQNPQQIRYQ